jgi:histone-lysine N-methyltransferase SETMAR
MWAVVDVARPTHVQSFIGAKKVMIWVSFSRGGIGNVVLLPPKEIFNCVFFIQKVLADFDKEQGRTRPMKGSRDTFFSLDNATPHRAPQYFDRLGIARLPHPPYSQDLAPCDFWLFGRLKRKFVRIHVWGSN